ncbi:VWA domain-containing protein [Actinoplanes oblitus]|uniref:VWA domain-containing protein n=1 Tax=Actinoplanes oblitus TaxID=3040509 RepID=A0ABY8W9J7_9ACTN|nr:VWA domain-containing protein [Actinoplanes oblitus]WIM93575.1 VWA domain-containing protein [Actinoplanes oblitus]
MTTSSDQTRRQVLYWRLIARLFDPEEQAALESGSMAIVGDLGLPAALLDPSVSVDTVVQRFPGLEAEFDSLVAAPGDDRDGEVRRAALVSKLLLNVFATGSGNVTAEQLQRWQADAGWFERAMGCQPGQLRGRGAGNGSAGIGGAGGAGLSPADASGLGGVLAGIEGDLVSRMRLREVLADNRLARQLTPSMSLIEQLLRDKDNLDGVALANAKALIRKFVDEVAEVLRTQVAQASTGTVDRSVPPKRIFRNLDLDRTIWKNLPNWSPEDERLYVDRLYYKQTAKRIEPARLIVVVDQSGSMVDAMVNCTILASIFAGLPKVDVHLIAYDTRALDLTPWVHDPFEVLLHTHLGGGTDGTVALDLARPKITDPRNTVVVWISDFYEWQEQAVFTGMQAIHRAGVKFIPVGSVSSGGHQSVNPWFRQRFKDQGTPVLSGHIKKLVTELKNFLV